ncbi:response regulator transcription factor [Salsipaludibacter albus]|uniref:response regulator transcription factor n=1 Tax=Salsipaludibacter albus TaxID=2849650 RepID=UPI001EE42EBD|nr:response regulator transcription factor [Salsipaludibacter albus]MBY5162649.1 response regulator transcription factor [Salsipaludibacter albus]
MSATSPRILFVEDDAAVRAAVTAALRGDGYLVRAQPDGRDIDSAIADLHPDLAILDIRLQVGPDGLALARRLRHGSDMPMIFLTAADELDDRLAGFDVGADDYLTKPFSVVELLARVRALLRRSGSLESDTWEVEDLVVNESGRSVRRGDRPLELTPTEFDLLSALGRRRGRVTSKEHLLMAVWQFDSYDPNLVEVHISALRRKLEEDGAPRLVHTVRGAGYVLRP